MFDFRMTLDLAFLQAHKGLLALLTVLLVLMLAAAVLLTARYLRRVAPPQAAQPDISARDTSAPDDRAE